MWVVPFWELLPAVTAVEFSCEGKGLDAKLGPIVALCLSLTRASRICRPPEYGYVSSFRRSLRCADEADGLPLCVDCLSHDDAVGVNPVNKSISGAGIVYRRGCVRDVIVHKSVIGHRSRVSSYDLVSEAVYTVHKERLVARKARNLNNLVLACRAAYEPPIGHLRNVTNTDDRAVRSNSAGFNRMRWIKCWTLYLRDYTITVDESTTGLSLLRRHTDELSLVVNAVNLGVPAWLSIVVGKHSLIQQKARRGVRCE